MGFGELFILAVGLAMDAFAVAVCKGLALKKITPGKALLVGLWFGGFQGLMPFIGYLLGTGFEDKIKAIDHWVAFILLGLIGLNMIREACSGEEEEADACLDVKSMFLLAVATSIDALAVGITFAFLKVNIGMWRITQTLNSFRVWASTPLLPSITMTAESAAISVR